LEVGAGTGRLTNELLAKASAVTAVDISEEMLTRVRAKYPDAGKLHLFQGDAHRLDQVTGYGSFDAVVSMRMLPHIEDIVGVLRLLCAAVKPGGFVIADFWNPRSYTYWRKRGSSVYNHYVPYDEARAMLLRAGLEILAIEGAGFQSPIDLNLEFLGRTPLKRFGYSLIAVCRRPC
jgi:ubiquinone/menaquinone biosynthesis C-methylase UbiE